MHSVSEILAGKSSDVLRIDASASVRDAVTAMVDANVGSLLVTDDGDVAGIVTERDYLRHAAVEGRPDRETPVREIMSTPVICVTPDTDIEECMALMTERRIRHVPVVDDGELVGMLSIGDVVKFQSTQQSVQIKYLTDYITAR
jgi:CBS domain-containing protein